MTAVTVLGSKWRLCTEILIIYHRSQDLCQTRQIGNWSTVVKVVLVTSLVQGYSIPLVQMKETEKLKFELFALRQFRLRG